MAPSPRPQYHLDLGNLPALSQPQNRSGSSTANSSPIEQPSSGSTRVPPGLEGGNLSGLSNTGIPARRGNNSSPSNEQTSSRFYPTRRARELQAEGSTRSLWGPPLSSGLSTPLKETIPESPNDDSFPDTKPDSLGPQRTSSFRRSRAGTAPSSAFPPIGGQASAVAASGSAKSSSRPTPSTSPFRPASSSISAGIGRSNSGASITSKSALLSRIRAGSMPQKPSLLAGSSPFGSSVFSSSWIASRDRANTYSGQRDADPGSPNSAFQRDFSDTDVKTLDYLGLADHAAQNLDGFGATNYMANQYPSSASAIHPLIANLSSVNRSNRFRSYSVNAKEKYLDDDEVDDYGQQYSGTITPSASMAAAALAETQAEIYKHNLEVQAFANQASASRPRARTAGVLDKPSSRVWRGFGSIPPGFNDNMVPPPLGMDEYANLNDAVRAMQLQGNAGGQMAGEFGNDTVAEATRSLWLGGIPTSTTSTSLRAIFEPFGRIESARVLTQKSCGFVNFEATESAIRARAQYNGKEIFPGGAAVRIGYAKAPSAAGTPGAANSYPSHSPDPFAQRDPNRSTSNLSAMELSRPRAASGAADKPNSVQIPLEELRPQILEIVKELGATDEEQTVVAGMVDDALRHGEYDREIPTIPEPSGSRMFDAPKLREIRKRIDNASYTISELDEIAMSMLPEIAEQAVDYLANTVVQKLFESCSEGVREAMLKEIAPTIAQISAHRNGTWAGQRAIALARTPTEISSIVENMRPYAAASYSDQYCNYAIQGCLRFQSPANNFIFEAMLSQLWPIAQGRFGARAMRACLESAESTKSQQKMVAAAIVLHSAQLATNTNGALLLTWFLDTASFPNRRKALAPRLISELVRLCTHKVAHTTVLKIINQRNEPDARDMILQALFFSSNDGVLEEVLKDQSCGALLVFKVLTTPFFDDDVRNSITENVRRILVKIKAQPSQGYKRLMDEVSLPTRGVSNNRDKSTRENSLTRSYDQENYISGSPYGSAQPRNNSDPAMNFDPYNMIIPGGSPINAQNQLQYQQMMANSGRQQMPYNINAASPTGFPATGVSPVDGFRGVPRAALPNSNSFPRMSTNQLGPPHGGFQPQPNFNAGAWQQQHQYGAGYAMPQQQSMMGGAVPRGRR